MSSELENRLVIEVADEGWLDADLRATEGLGEEATAWLDERGNLIDTELSVIAASEANGIERLAGAGFTVSAEEVIRSWTSEEPEGTRWHYLFATEISDPTPRGAFAWCASDASSFVSAPVQETGPDGLRVTIFAGEDYDGYEVLAELLLRFVAAAHGAGIRARGFVLGTGQEGGFVGGRTEDGETEVFFEEELQNLVPEVMEPFVPEGALEMPD
ncbi:MAG: hypothetical protein JJ863_10175 [Deltaproteobacteria bacterium]|nr:hypothetical protein [Deltaproteobacteria bacterium]